MSRFKVGDRVRVELEGSEFIRDEDTGTITELGHEDAWVLWDNPRKPNLSGRGWCVLLADLRPERAGAPSWLQRNRLALVLYGQPIAAFALAVALFLAVRAVLS